jgi:dihydroneopterin triphosphate diphosphatase
MSDSGHTIFKRPESVLVVVYTRAGEVLLLERHEPRGWWQSVTGSLEPGETPWEAAVRELGEETGLAPEGLVDLRISERFPILPAWRARYADGVTENLEHAFALRLEARPPVRLNPAEHADFVWLKCNIAMRRASSSTNRTIIKVVCG